MTFEEQQALLWFIRLGYEIEYSPDDNWFTDEKPDPKCWHMFRYRLKPHEDSK